MASAQGSDGRTQAERLAGFAVRATWEDVSPEARDRLKLNLLDSLGCAIGALAGTPVQRLRAQIDEFGGSALCTLVGGGMTAPDRAASYTTALTRYLDFMDNLLASGETCHPSDNIGSVLAASELAGRDGATFLTALAVAYQVEIRLTQQAPVMASGFDHTTQLAFSISAGISRALGLDAHTATGALGACGSDFGSTAVIRAAPTTEWKGLASSATALAASHATYLAARGISAPRNVFEGPKGFMEAVGHRFEIDWDHEPLDAVLETSLKRHNAEIHTQTSIEAALAIRAEHAIDPAAIERIDVETFLEAYEIVGGGTYGDRTEVATKEEADHSLPYVVAVALLDGEVTPAQYPLDRVRREDVQALLRRVHVSIPSHLERVPAAGKRLDPATRAYPEEMPAHVMVRLRDGTRFEAECREYPGFHSRPFGWNDVEATFDRLAEPFADAALRAELVACVRSLDRLRVADLTALLARAGQA